MGTGVAAAVASGATCMLGIAADSVIGTVAVAGEASSVTGLDNMAGMLMGFLAEFKGSLVKLTDSLAEFTGSLEELTSSLTEFTGSLAEFTGSLAAFAVSVVFVTFVCSGGFRIPEGLSVYLPSSYGEVSHQQNIVMSRKWMVDTYSTAGDLVVRGLASDLESNVVGGVALELKGRGGGVVEIPVQELHTIFWLARRPDGHTQTQTRP